MLLLELSRMQPPEPLPSSGQCELTCLLAREATEGWVEFCEATIEAECLSPALRTIGCPFSEQLLYFKGALARLSLLGPSHPGYL